ncbi:MAG: NUDIX hydrolase [Candidatus Moranbacteria bacterium]|nr:NUDIX hydrolase [Candidatus Moranbacteria bacterium]
MENKQKIIVSGILETENGILLAKRPLTKKIAPGIYHLPGGHVEFGETPEEALVREFMEEFYLKIKVLDIIRAFSYCIAHTHTIGITYKIIVDSIPEEIEFDKKETEQIDWVDEMKLDNYLKQEDHDYDTLKKYFLTK